MHHEIDNEDRREWARLTLDRFGELTGQTGYAYDDPDCLREIAGDLICNLLHLADAAGLDADGLIESGRFHYDSEHENDESDREDCDECGEAIPTDETSDVNRYHASSCSLHPDNVVGGPTIYDHDARPDDLPEPGDRCKECGEPITWVGPSPAADWLHVNDERNR